MTDDLVKRLLDWSEYDEGKINDAREEAAYRIGQLQETVEVMQDQIRELQWNLECKDDLHQQDYERLRHYQIALSDISKMTMCMAVSYADLAQKQKDIAIAALEEKKDG